MNRHFDLKLILMLTACLSVSEVATAEKILYENDFESGALRMDAPDPSWIIKSGTISRYGPGNLFEISTTTSHSGNYSLHFNYEGKNGICNACGTKKITQKPDHDSVTYVLDASGQNLSLDPYLTSPGRILFNQSNGNSKWRVVSVDSQDATNDKLTLEKLADSINGDPSRFYGGDSILLARQCGIDGFIGKNIDRRSDCDIAVTWFNNISQNYGESIFRRVYLKPEIKSHPYHQKLNYWRTPNSKEIVLYAEYTPKMNPDVHPFLTGFNDKGGLGAYRPAGVFNSGVWYYIEQEFKAQSAPGINDGEYRLWFAEAGKETNTPAIEIKNLSLAPVENASFWGNEQHNDDTSGSWYIDDIKISTTKVGPTSTTGINIAPPMPPSVN